MTPHRKNFYFLVLMRQGSGRHWVDMRPYPHQANTLYFTAPLQVSLLEQEMPFDGLALGFTAEFLGLDQPAGFAPLPLLSPAAGGHALRLPVTEVTFLDAVLAHMLAEYRQQRPWYLDMLRASLRTVLIRLSRLHQEQSDPLPVPEPTLLAQFTTLVEAHYTTHHQVAQYAKLLCRSPGYLNERVRQLSGQPALAHIQARLVLEAKRYLFHTRLSVAEISFALGFGDPSYFGRFFRRDTGLSPAAYRAATVEMYQLNAAPS
ncbi:AraC family transcriptional regulator [Hymenobacter coccineus]|uniref:AraC family transcriptional regulator n=1 Tax=Hymenobacter coccineus TaxID=1908235 RepID=UPI00130178B9|nr:helix-turn-helix domain-containing protein [Hymenobacter coccineus]